MVFPIELHVQLKLQLQIPNDDNFNDKTASENLL